MSLSNVKTVISTLTITIHGNGDVIYPDELEDTINEKSEYKFNIIFTIYEILLQKLNIKFSINDHCRIDV
jgi:hypothetical protein